jgi:hypothetical protein
VGSLPSAYGAKALSLGHAESPPRSRDFGRPTAHDPRGLDSEPWAFLIFLAYVVGWCVFDAHSLNWHEIATLATWLMTLCIQRAEHRDTHALQAKIDALIHAVPGAEDALRASMRRSRNRSNGTAAVKESGSVLMLPTER